MLNQNEQLLDNLAKRFGSDKRSECHNYCHFYDALMRRNRMNVKSVLEIGVLDGASLRMWREYFPNAIIHGIDIEDKSKYNEERIKTHVIDQADREGLSKFAQEHGPFDFILDDGGHYVYQQTISLGVLFEHCSWMYVVEDAHTSFISPWKDNCDNLLEQLELFDGTFKNSLLLKSENTALSKGVDQIYILRNQPKDSTTAVILKK